MVNPYTMFDLCIGGAFGLTETNGEFFEDYNATTGLNGGCSFSDTHIFSTRVGTNLQMTLFCGATAIAQASVALPLPGRPTVSCFTDGVRVLPIVVVVTGETASCCPENLIPVEGANEFSESFAGALSNPPYTTSGDFVSSGGFGGVVQTLGLGNSGAVERRPLATGRLPSKSPFYARLNLNIRGTIAGDPGVDIFGAQDKSMIFSITDFTTGFQRVSVTIRWAFPADDGYGVESIPGTLAPGRVNVGETLTIDVDSVAGMIQVSGGSINITSAFSPLTINCDSVLRADMQFNCSGNATGNATGLSNWACESNVVYG